MRDPRTFVADITDQLPGLELEANTAWWAANTASSDAAEARLAAADLAVRAYFSDPDAYAAVRDALATARSEADGGAGDPLLTRQLEILHDRFLPNQVAADLRTRLVALETKVGSVYNRHRAVVDGEELTDNELAVILRTGTDDARRRAAWEASKQVGVEVADDIRALARLRNEAARGLGFRDHFELALVTADLDPGRLFGTLDELDRLTDDVWCSRKDGIDARIAATLGVDVGSLRPWHYADPFFQELPVAPEVACEELFADRNLEALTATTFAALGLETGPLLAASDLYARPAKSQHAFCVHLDRAGDVRVLANVVPNRSWMGTMLHEFGHAVYDAALDPALPWLLREPAHALTTEAVALLFGRLTNDVEWLETVAGLSAVEAENRGPTIAAAKSDSLLVALRWMLVMTYFERELYSDPDADLNTIWWDLVSRFQHVTKPDGRDAPDWAAKIHVALAPVYYQNYIYGEMLASQIEATLADATGGLVGAPEAGAFLAERFFRPGASLRWDHLVRAATGSELSPHFLVDQIVGH